MGRMTRLGAMLVVGTMLGAGPLYAEEMPFPASLDGAYTGNLVVELFPADGGFRISRDRGEAEVNFARQPDGTVRFVTRGQVDDFGGFEVSVLLTSQEGGIWRSLSTEGVVQLDGEGRLLSISRDDGFELIWSGEIGQQDGRLTFRRIPTAEAPAGERDITAIFSLAVERPRPEPAPAPEPDPAGGEAEASDGDGGCARIEWRLVNRWNPWGGGLRLDREPHCVQ